MDDGNGVIKYFVERRKPATVVQLGCDNWSSEYLDRNCDMLTIFENRIEWLDDFERTSGVDAIFRSYLNVQDALEELDTYGLTFDLAVIGGTLVDRGAFAQQQVNRLTRTILLTDSHEGFRCGYNSLRTGDYLVRRFQNPNNEATTVLLRNDLNLVKIEGFN